MISFKTSRRDSELLNIAADRAVAMARDHGLDYTKSDALMDLTACHANGCALDLPKLLAADEFNFAHDAFGIRRYLDRQTGQLTQCFIPRCAAHDRNRDPVDGRPIRTGKAGR